MSYGVTSNRATFNLGVKESASLLSTGVKAVAVHHIELTTASVKEHTFLIASKGAYYKIRYVKLQTVTRLQSFFLFIEFLVVGKDKMALANINLCC